MANALVVDDSSDTVEVTSELLESAESARAAGLRHVDPDTMSGLKRLRRGAGFAYLDGRGRRLREPATLERIRKLAIPPAWDDVWICPIANGHIQARGRDARRRKQYRYEPRWFEMRSATKFHRMIDFAAALPRIRAACDRDMRRRELSRDKVLATLVRLLEVTHIRVGNEEYARTNGSYGLTTLRDRHVRIHGADLLFRFRGKSGRARQVGICDRRLARIVGECSDLPGHELFQYVAEDGTPHGVDSSDVNGYIRGVAGKDFTAKDFRTWAGTVLAACTLRALAPCATRGRAKKNVVQCIKTVAAALGNTPSVCKRSYVHPAVVDSYLRGSLASTRARGDEAFVRALLAREGRLSKTPFCPSPLSATRRAPTRRRSS
jgi:DNA topoisomerase-1